MATHYNYENRLTPKEQSFVLEYLRNNHNGTKAVQAIDPDVKHPAQVANRLLMKDHIQAAIEEKKRSIYKRYDASFEAMQQKVFQLIEKVENNEKMQTLGAYKFILECIQQIGAMEGHNKKSITPEQANILVQFVPFAQQVVEAGTIKPSLPIEENKVVPFSFSLPEETGSNGVDSGKDSDSDSETEDWNNDETLGK